MVEEDNTPLSVTVTPCDAPLEWKLTLQELPEEASGEASGIDGAGGSGGGGGGVRASGGGGGLTTCCALRRGVRNSVELRP